MDGFNNLIEVTTYFSDRQRATEYLIKKRWPNGVRCAHCDNDKVYELKGKKKVFKCAKCRKQFSATKGTIFENSPISLQKWFVAIYLITAHKKGISSHQLARDLTITQKSAWFVLHRVRFILDNDFAPSSGSIVEVDETYVGGKTKNKHQNKIEKNEHGNTVSTKVAVMGILERGGEIKTIALSDTKAKTLITEINKNVPTDVTVMTDELPAYKNLSRKYDHYAVNHSAKEYVNGRVHTNGVENYWSLFQRGIIGIYHQISPKHLSKYLLEFDFRFNTRKFTERNRFDKTIGKCNKRLTYAILIDNGEDKSFFKFRPEA